MAYIEGRNSNERERENTGKEYRKKRTTSRRHESNYFNYFGQDIQDERRCRHQK